MAYKYEPQQRVHQLDGAAPQSCPVSFTTESPSALPSQEKLDLSDDQRGALAAALHRYQGAFGALAQERSAINAALVAAATPGKDGLKKVRRAAAGAPHLFYCTALACVCTTP